jgi:predicted ATPase
LNDADAPIIGKVCRKLDGIALALELAAGRVGVYGINGMRRSSIAAVTLRVLLDGRQFFLKCNKRGRQFFE